MSITDAADISKSIYISSTDHKRNGKINNRKRKRRRRERGKK
ncbi:hypothetical protein [Brachyspira hyodysenteriae]|nr:hypothetical protein [Brachyspira hyodysenteriae]